MQLMNQQGAPTPSPDGKWILYTVSFPDWKEARRQSDLFLVSTTEGVPSTRQSLRSILPLLVRGGARMRASAGTPDLREAAR